MPPYNGIGAYSLPGCLFVSPSSLCECNSSEVVGPIAVIFGRIIDHEV